LPLAAWPVEQRGDWLGWVNEPQTSAELEALRISVNKDGLLAKSISRHA
jgi:hypothetical protein